MAKIQPAVSTILLNIPAKVGDDNGVGYLDLSQCASIVNRRFYRQGLNWAVASFRCNQTGGVGGGRFQIEKLPETWVMSNAWHKAFANWQRQAREVLEDSGSEDVRAKYRDFKIFMDTGHYDAVASPSQANGGALLPVKSGGGSFLTGTSGAALAAEWDYSEVVIPNRVNADGSGNDPLTDPFVFKLHMVGIGLNPSKSLGIIDGYENSRAVPHSPDPTVPAGVDAANDNWLSRMFDDGNANPEILDVVTDNNDELPYPQLNYPGGDEMASVLQLHAHTDISSSVTAVDNSFIMAGTQVPCGLLKFTNKTDKVMEVFVDLVPGHHRGYLCEPMQEF